MTRPPAYIFNHLVDITPRLTRGSGGMIPGVVRLQRPAFIDDTATKVTDERDGSQGQEIVASGTVHTFLEDYAAPGSTIVLRPGTPAERHVVVVAARYFDHVLAPEHAELSVI